VYDDDDRNNNSNDDDDDDDDETSSSEGATTTTTQKEEEEEMMEDENLVAHSQGQRAAVAPVVGLFVFQRNVRSASQQQQPLQTQQLQHNNE